MVHKSSEPTTRPLRVQLGYPQAISNITTQWITTTDECDECAKQSTYFGDVPYSFKNSRPIFCAYCCCGLECGGNTI